MAQQFSVNPNDSTQKAPSGFAFDTGGNLIKADSSGATAPTPPPNTLYNPSTGTGIQNGKVFSAPAGTGQTATVNGNNTSVASVNQNAPIIPVTPTAPATVQPTVSQTVNPSTPAIPSATNVSAQTTTQPGATPIINLGNQNQNTAPTQNQGYQGTPQQKQELDAAYHRILSGSGSATDATNVNYARQKKGYVPPGGKVGSSPYSPFSVPGSNGTINGADVNRDQGALSFPGGGNVSNPNLNQLGGGLNQGITTADGLVNQIATMQSTPEIKAQLDKLQQASDEQWNVIQQTKQVGQNVTGLLNSLVGPNVISNIQQLNTLIAQKTQEYNQSNVNIMNQPGVGSTAILGQQAALNRQKAIELGNLTIAQQAMMGNLKVASDYAQQVEDLQFKPLEEEQSALQNFFSQNKDILTNEQQQQGNAIDKAMLIRQEAIDRQKADYQANTDLLTKVAIGGGDPSIIDMNKTPAENTVKAAPYIYKTSQANTMVQDVGGRKVLFDSAGNFMQDLGPSDNTSRYTQETDLLGKPTGRVFDNFTKQWTVAPGFTGDVNNPIPTGQNRPQRNQNPLNMTLGSTSSPTPPTSLSSWTQRYVSSGDATIEQTPSESTDKNGNPQYLWHLTFKDTATAIKDTTDMMYNSPTYKNSTVEQALKTWSGGAYGSSDLGLPPQIGSMKVSQMPPDVWQNTVMPAMAQREGWFDKGQGSALAPSATPSNAPTANSNYFPPNINPVNRPVIDSTLSQGTHTISTGDKYFVLPPNIDPAIAQAITLTAGGRGLRVLTPQQGEQLQSVDRANTELNQQVDSIRNLLPSNAATRPFVGIKNAIGGFLHTANAAKLNAINDNFFNAIGTLKTVAGSAGLRITNTEIAGATQSSLPGRWTTIPEIDAKLKLVNQAANDLIDDLLNRPRRSGDGGAGLNVSSDKVNAFLQSKGLGK